MSIWSGRDREAAMLRIGRGHHDGQQTPCAILALLIETGCRGSRGERG
jgi:hypothetical protein